MIAATKSVIAAPVVIQVAIGLMTRTEIGYSTESPSDTPDVVIMETTRPVFPEVRTSMGIRSSVLEFGAKIIGAGFVTPIRSLIEFTLIRTEAGALNPFLMVIGRFW